MATALEMPPVAFKDRTFSAAELALAREVIARHAGLSRQERANRQLEREVERLHRKSEQLDDQVTRKVCGGNRTWDGARTQQSLASVILRTCRQQHRDPLASLARLLHAREPQVARVLLPRHGDESLRFPGRH